MSSASSIASGASRSRNLVGRPERGYARILPCRQRGDTNRIVDPQQLISCSTSSAFGGTSGSVSTSSRPPVRSRNCTHPRAAIPVVATGRAETPRSSWLLHPLLIPPTTLSFGSGALVNTPRETEEAGARRANSRRLITRPRLASSTLRTDCLLPSRYTRGFVFSFWGTDQSVPCEDPTSQEVSASVWSGERNVKP